MKLAIIPNLTVHSSIGTVQVVVIIIELKRTDVPGMVRSRAHTSDAASVSTYY